MPNKLPTGIDVLFVAGFGPVVTDQKAAERLYCDLLQLPLERGDPAMRARARKLLKKYKL